MDEPAGIRKLILLTEPGTSITRVKCDYYHKPFGLYKRANGPEVPNSGTFARYCPNYMRANVFAMNGITNL